MDKVRRFDKLNVLNDLNEDTEPHIERSRDEVEVVEVTILGFISTTLDGRSTGSVCVVVSLVEQSSVSEARWGLTDGGSAFCWVMRVGLDKYQIVGACFGH